MAKIEVLKRILIKDKNGKIKYDSGLVSSNSFVIAFLEHIYCPFDDVAVSIEDTGNTARNVQTPTLGNVFLLIDAVDDDDNYGIVVGTGTTAEANTDYALATQIAHGTGAGQLDYGAHSFTVPSIVGSSVDMVVSRTFYNGSGSSITVNEIGIYCESKDTGAVARYFCILRDVLTTPEVVANTETLTVQYTIRTTV